MLDLSQNTITSDSKTIKGFKQGPIYTGKESTQKVTPSTKPGHFRAISTSN